MRKILGRAFVPALFIAALAGCDAATDPAVQPPTEAALTLEQGGYTLVEGRLPAELESLDRSRLIGPDGGSIHLAGHAIEVPAGAVDEPTLFTMTVLANGHVEVELTAVVTDVLGETVDVGEAGFGEKSVALTLSYASAEDVDSPDDLLILRVLDDGVVEPLDVVVDSERRTVTARLDHFSRYCLASN